MSAGAADRLVTEVFAVAALVRDALAEALAFIFVMTGLLKSRRAPGEGALLAELMDKSKYRRRPTGWFLTHLQVHSAQYYSAASAAAADTRIIAENCCKIKPFFYGKLLKILEKLA